MRHLSETLPILLQPCSRRRCSRRRCCVGGNIVTRTGCRNMHVWLPFLLLLFVLYFPRLLAEGVSSSPTAVGLGAFPDASVQEAASGPLSGHGTGEGDQAVPKPSSPNTPNPVKHDNPMPWLTADFVETLTLHYGYNWHALQSSLSGIQITVHYLPGDEVWAQNTLQSAHLALPLLERLTGQPFMFGHDLHLWALREVDFPLAGLNIQERGILLSRSQNAVVHELAHFWVGSHSLSEPWMAEGLAELYSFLVENQLLGRAWRPISLDQLRASVALDGPLALWPGLNPLQLAAEPLDADRFYYEKAFLFWYTLYRVHGPTLIRDFHRWLRTLKAPADTADLLVFVQQHATRNVPSIWELFPGWLVTGDYRLNGRHQSFEWYLEDDDDDGVCNLEEQLLHLDPATTDSDGDGLTDGWELYEGRNPGRLDPGGRVRNITWVVPQLSPSSTHRFVRAGEMIRIKAEGLWRVGGPETPWTGPEGIALASGMPSAMPGDTEDRLSDPNLEVPGELVAQIGWGPQGGKRHRIGRQSSFVADRSGILYLAGLGPEHLPGRGNLLAAVQGGQPLPQLDRDSRILTTRSARVQLLQNLREASITQLELTGRHVVLSLHPTDLESLSQPDAVLAWLDRLYEHYRELLPEAPYQGRRILLSFDVLSREELKTSAGGLVLTFGLQHLYALPDAVGPGRGSWPFAVGLALPFLEWYQADSLIEPAHILGMAELMAARVYTQLGAEPPPSSMLSQLLTSGRMRVPADAVGPREPRAVEAFLLGLLERFGWRPFREMLVENGTRSGRRRGARPATRPQANSLEPFLEAFARASGANLSEFYSAWGMPVTTRLKEVLEPLPVLAP